MQGMEWGKTPVHSKMPIGVLLCPWASHPTSIYVANTGRLKAGDGQGKTPYWVRCPWVLYPINICGKGWAYGHFWHFV